MASLAQEGVIPPTNSPFITTWKDTSGNGNDGTLKNFGATSPWGGVGSPSNPYELTLNGTSEYVQPPALYACDTKVFSYEAWFTVPAIPAANMQIVEESGSGGSTFTGLQITNTSGNPYLVGNWGDATVTTPPPAVSVCNGALHHLVGTCNGINFNLYLDGALLSGPIAMPSGTQTSLYASLGCRLTGTSSYVNNFGGTIAVARIYKSCLTAAQVTHNYLAGLMTLPTKML
jgi:hypothetical protein